MGVLRFGALRQARVQCGWSGGTTLGTEMQGVNSPLEGE